MRAMILAAGLGTRLRPLTNDRPKALVEIGGRTLLELTLTRLASFGVREVIINVHHFTDLVIQYLKTNNNFGLQVEISREELLLDTGGGLKKASWFFLQDPNRLEEPFILHNVDVVSTIDFHRLMNFHNENRSLATLAVQKRESSRYLLFDERGELCGRQIGRDQEPEIVRSTPNTEALAFSGIHVISPRLLNNMTEEGVFSIIGTYLRLAGQDEKIRAFRADECQCASAVRRSGGADPLALSCDVRLCRRRRRLAADLAQCRGIAQARPHNRARRRHPTKARGVDRGAGAYRHARGMRARKGRQPVPDANRARHGGSRQSSAGRCSHAALIRIRS